MTGGSVVPALSAILTTMSPTERSAQFFSNIAHVITHMSVILYATAVLHLPGVFGVSYGEMLGFASLGLVLYGVAALPPDGLVIVGVRLA